MYYVAKRFGRTETRLQEFSKEPEAVSFIMEKLQEDKLYKLDAVYCLYEGADIVQEYSQSDVVAPAESSGAESDTAASGKGSDKSFRPSPFSTTPRIGPQTWIVGDDKDQKDDDEKKS